MVSKTRRIHTPHNKKIQTHNKKPILIGVVHATWCGHCKSLMGEPIEAENGPWFIMKKKIDGKGFKVIEIESEQPDKDILIENINKEIKGGNKLEVQGFPTIFRVKNGHLDKFEQERNEDNLLTWAKGGASEQLGGNKKARKSVKASRKRRRNKSLQSTRISSREKLPISLTSTVLRMNGGGCPCDKIT